MHKCFSHFQVVRRHSEPSTSSEVEDFLTKIKGVPLPESLSARIHNAYELVDWLRLIEPTVCDANDAAVTPSVLEVLEFVLDALKGSFTCASSGIPASQLLRLYGVFSARLRVVTLPVVQMLAHRPPASSLEWVQTLRSNIRKALLGLLGKMWKSVELSDMQPSPYVTFIRIIDSISRSLWGILSSNFLYPCTACFLQRPELVVTDVPMLYDMLHGSSDDWKRERGWIIRFLSGGMMSTEDWKVLKRRHTWELLSSLVQSSVRD
ncbi:hypothetical protein BDR04DRAFT_1162323 [Suillus decipiens]|nr:hypothetical protein BDR04DRAFT_1162323 [Suillus decipiens]